MKKYFVKYHGGFANSYELAYTEGDEHPTYGWERITRKEAIRLCAAEKYRRAHDQAFSGYADTMIRPYRWTEEDMERYEMYGDNGRLEDGYILVPRR